MKKCIFKGSGVALVTPFNKSGEVNYFELKRLIEFQIVSNTNAIIILGTTGEASTITDDERIKIIKFTVNQVAGRIPVIVGTGSNSTQRAITLTKQAEELGADAALIVSPYYNKTTQKGLIEHFKLIAKTTKLPIILYNVPSRTGLNILPETVVKLAKIKNIVAIKEASGDISQIIKLIKIKPPSFKVYSGDDMLTFPMISLGASGVVSVTANCYPSEVSQLCKHSLRGEHKQALLLHNKLHEINKNLFLEVNPICIKHYMNLIGRNVGGTRPPLTTVSKETHQKLMSTKAIYET